MVLTVTENKVQLIDLICQQVQEKATYIPASEDSFNYKLVMTGSGYVPQQIHMGIVISRHDLTTSHEEADVIIPQQMVVAADTGTERIAVICDDTDVFFLLLHYYHLKKLSTTLLMEGTSVHRNVTREAFNL